ncbi:glutathione peroxidase [Flavobacteriaceae bacterium MAR_2010_188]|nr:glutathione peroxidase [Flavobacteriaceae bacterium MAR_2010_188]
MNQSPQVLVIIQNPLKSELPTQSFYEIEINDINGDKIDLYNFRGKHILVVNVATQCGLRKQYHALQKLHMNHLKNLQVIGVPCNQFLNQEPGTNQEISDVCKDKYDISFLLTEKINVKGREMHPMYKWLTDKEINGRLTSEVIWNFQKYLLGQNGSLIDYFYPLTSPNSKKILQYIE